MMNESDVFQGSPGYPPAYLRKAARNIEQILFRRFGPVYVTLEDKIGFRPFIEVRLANPPNTRVALLKASNEELREVAKVLTEATLRVVEDFETGLGFDEGMRGGVLYLDNTRHNENTPSAIKTIAEFSPAKITELAGQVASIQIKKIQR